MFLGLLAGALPGCFYFLKDKEKRALYLLVAALILPAAINFKTAFSEVNWHDNQVTREWLDATFDHLPENAVFIAQHDAEAFGALHDQAVNGKRKDVYVVVEGRLPTTW